MPEPRPKIKVRMKINKLTGEIEELIVDDQARLAPEEYHDKVAELVARALARKADIVDTALEKKEAEREPAGEAEEERERRAQENR